MEKFVTKKIGDVELHYGNEGYITDNIGEALHILSEKGVVILTDVLDEKECKEMRDGAFITASFLTNGEVQKKDPTTWTKTRFLGPLHGGLFQHYSWSHAKYVWDVRQNPKVMAFHSAFYGTKDLMVSFDGINFSTGYATYDGHYKVHIDQGFGEDQLGKQICIQSWVTSEDVGIGDGTFRFLEDSFKFHGEFGKAFGLTKQKKGLQDWYALYNPKNPMIKTAQYHWYEKKMKENGKQFRDICLTCPAGSMVFWDSRTVHSGIEKLPGEEGKPYLRNLVYVCYMPRERCEHTIKDRKCIFDPKNRFYLRTTNHWPNKFNLFSEHNPRCKIQDVRQLPSPEKHLTLLGRRIAGLD